MESPLRFLAYFPFIIVLTSIFVSLYLKLKFKNYIGIAVGLLFIASALVPVGGYHLRSSNVPVLGILWGFMVPTGWYCIVVGVVLLFHKRLRLENKRLALVMFAAGLLFFPIVFRQDIEYFLGLWRGVSGDFDLEGPRWLIALHYSGALIGLFVSLLVMLEKDQRRE